MDSFEDRGYRWAEITNLTDMQQNRRVFTRGTRLDVPGSKIEQLAAELLETGETWNDDAASFAYIDAAERLRELLT